MLYSEVLEKATTEDIIIFIANRNLGIREDERTKARNKARAKANASQSRRR